jgi:hypothetical protein
VTGSVLLELVIVALLFICAGIIANIAWRAQKLIWKKDVPSNGWMNQLAHRWAKASLRIRAAAEDRDRQAKTQQRIKDEQAFNAKRASLARVSTNASVSKELVPEPAFYADPTVPLHSEGKMAHFVYVDVDGVVTDRKVKDWRTDGKYLQGHCQLRRAHRVFLLDRIEEWRS